MGKYGGRPNPADDDEQLDEIIAAKTGDLGADGAEEDFTYPTIQRPLAVAPAASEEPKTPTVLPLSKEFETLMDGSLRGVITISPENSELLRTWADGADTDLSEYVNEQVNEALMAYAASTSGA